MSLVYDGDLEASFIIDFGEEARLTSSQLRQLHGSSAVGYRLEGVIDVTSDLGRSDNEAKQHPSVWGSPQIL